MKLNPNELREHARACGLRTDAERQAAFAALDARIRERLPGIPAHRYYTFEPLDGTIVVDPRRDRPVKKSDQP
jgi:hypothetical protein